MARYDRSYDYGLRGFRGPAPRISRGSEFGAGRRPPPSGYDRRFGYDERNQARQGTRVTAPYNADYVTGARGRPYDRNYTMYTGDRLDRMGDGRMYRQPYNTIGGTRTMRGATFATGYDYPEYGPDYGGRYPDEL